MSVVEQKPLVSVDLSGAMANSSKEIAPQSASTLGMATANRTAVSLAERAPERIAERVLENDEKLCWIEVKRYPYQPDHQVELLHLQAEADALLIKLQAKGQKKQLAGKKAVSG
jgi:hypothetical protein